MCTYKCVSAQLHCTVTHCELNAQLSKKELKIQAKPWITNGIRFSIKRRDKLLRKFIKRKDEVLKDELYSIYIRRHSEI